MKLKLCWISFNPNGEQIEKSINGGDFNLSIDDILTADILRKKDFDNWAKTVNQFKLDNPAHYESAINHMLTATIFNEKANDKKPLIQTKGDWKNALRGIRKV